MEIKSQIHLRNQQFQAAKECLEIARKTFEGETTLDQLFVSKWLAVIESHRQGSTFPLQQFRLKAEKAADWESVRESDLFSLTVHFEQKRFDHLYFGTPFEGYRRRIQKVLSLTPMADTYLYGSESAPIFNLAKGELDGRCIVNPGKANHRLLVALSQDFYRPLSLGGLFAHQFPDEHYNPYSSPDRIHQALFRFRAWVERQRLPLQVLEINGCYSLVFNGPMAILISRNSETMSRNHLLLERLRNSLTSLVPNQINTFNSRQACSILNVSPSSFKRWAQWALAQGFIERLGSAKKTVYQLKLKPQPLENYS